MSGDASEPARGGAHHDVASPASGSRWMEMGRRIGSSSALDDRALIMIGSSGRTMIVAIKQMTGLDHLDGGSRATRGVLPEPGREDPVTRNDLEGVEDLGLDVCPMAADGGLGNAEACRAFAVGEADRKCGEHLEAGEA